MKKTKTASITYPRASRLLKDLGEEGFRRICECMQVKELHLRNKEQFVYESDPCNRIGIVITGAVQLTRNRIDGSHVVLETVQANDSFGATYAFRDVATMGVGMRAVGETTVILFDIERITHPCHKVCFAHIQFVRNLLAVMSQKAFQIKQKLRIVSQRTIRDRLMTLLHIYAKRTKSSEFDLPYNRQALADFLCVDRSALSNEISKLQKAKLIAVERNHFKLLAKAR